MSIHLILISYRYTVKYTHTHTKTTTQILFESAKAVCSRLRLHVTSLHYSLWSSVNMLNGWSFLIHVFVFNNRRSCSLWVPGDATSEAHIHTYILLVSPWRRVEIIIEIRLGTTTSPCFVHDSQSYRQHMSCTLATHQYFLYISSTYEQWRSQNMTLVGNLVGAFFNKKL